MESVYLLLRKAHKSRALKKSVSLLKESGFFYEYFTHMGHLRIVIVTYCMLTYCIQKDIINWVNNMNIVKVFANNLKYYRNKMGISQEQFADRAGLHRTYISAIECGKRSISLDNIQKIAEALEIETYLLFVDDCDKKDRKKAGGK